MMAVTLPLMPEKSSVLLLLSSSSLRTQTPFSSFMPWRTSIVVTAEVELLSNTNVLSLP
ncbi:hypothetical protein ACMA110817_29965 [Achromobacter marplatensis]